MGWASDGTSQCIFYGCVRIVNTCHKCIRTIHFLKLEMMYLSWLSFNIVPLDLHSMSITYEWHSCLLHSRLRTHTCKSSHHLCSHLRSDMGRVHTRLKMKQVWSSCAIMSLIELHTSFRRTFTISDFRNVKIPCTICTELLNNNLFPQSLTYWQLIFI